MKCSVIVFSVLITIFGFYVEVSSRISSSISSCPELHILNGRARVRSRGRMVRFSCYPGFRMVGNKYAACTTGFWDVPPPVCVNSNCAPIKASDNLVVSEKLDGAFLIFFCEPGYELNGPAEIYCNGRRWNDTVPTCKRTLISPPTSCDFEKPDLCNWEQDPLHDFDWKRHNFDTPSRGIGTGPSHDHTSGAGYDGYYLYIEATDKPENSTARIISPLYSSNLTEAGCFSFWYHMYGSTIGSLNIYYKAEGEIDQKIMFTESGNQGNQWRNGLFDLPREKKNFQLIIEGVRGPGYVSDIAIDDVAILQGEECSRSVQTTEIAVSEDDDQVELVDGMQSCRGRCNESITTINSGNLCECDQECYLNRNCCPDFLAYCIIIVDDAGQDFTTDTTIDFEPTIPTTTMEPKRSSTGPDPIPISISPKDGIDPYPPKPTEDSDKQSTMVPEIFRKSTVVPRRRTSQVYRTSTDGVPSTKNVDKRIVTLMPSINDSHQMNHERVKVTMSGVIAIVIGSLVGIVGTGLIVFLILQKRNSYKKNSGTSALSDDSDVRFLTSDEMLDFNIARPEDMEM